MPPGRPISKVEISLNNPEKSIEQLKQLSHSHGNKIKILALIKKLNESFIEEGTV